MIDGLMEWSRNIVYFSIFAVLIKNLLPGEKYTPYVRLYIGFMMILVFFTPLLKMLEVDATLQYLTEILGGTLERKEDSFLASIYENSNYERQKEEYTKLLEDSVVEYLTECMGKQIKWQGYRVEQAQVSWKEREEDREFADLAGITVYLRKEDFGAEKEGLEAEKEELGTRKEELGAEKEELGTRKEELGAGKEELGTEKEKLGDGKESEAKKGEGEIWIEPVLIEVRSGLEKEEKEESGQLKRLLAQVYHLREEDIMVRIAE